MDSLSGTYREYTGDETPHLGFLYHPAWLLRAHGEGLLRKKQRICNDLKKLLEFYNECT